MKLLNEILSLVEDTNLSSEFKFIRKDINSLKEKIEFLITEGFIEDNNGPLEADFDRVEKMYLAARRALGLANKLPNPEQKSKVKGDVINKMNAIRKELYDLMVRLNMNDDAQRYHHDRIKNSDIKSRDAWGNIGKAGGRTFASPKQTNAPTPDQAKAREAIPNIHRKDGDDNNLPSGHQQYNPPMRRRSWF